jgi:hypothetical protein
MEPEHAALKTPPLHCRLHLYHHYRKAATEDGQVYERCIDCGRERLDYPDPDGPGHSMPAG